jgi:hypothetical protein
MQKSKEPPSLTIDQKMSVCRQVLSLIEASIEIASETGVVLDIQNDNIWIVKKNEECLVRYVDSFGLYWVNGMYNGVLINNKRKSEIHKKNPIYRRFTPREYIVGWNLESGNVI